MLTATACALRNMLHTGSLSNDITNQLLQSLTSWSLHNPSCIFVILSGLELSDIAIPRTIFMVSDHANFEVREPFDKSPGTTTFLYGTTPEFAGRLSKLVT